MFGVFYRDDVKPAPLNLLLDSGFEGQIGRKVSPPWLVEGPCKKGIDIGLGFAHTGQSNAYIHTEAEEEWHAMTQITTIR